MQEQDIISKEFFEDDERTADLVNVALFHGKQLIGPKDIREADSASFGKVRWFGRWTGKQQYRDVLRRMMLGCRFAIIGIENQGVVHFAMPVRTMGYDFMSYDKQVKAIRRRHRKAGNLKGKAQFLSGMTQQDLLAPTITIVVYYGEEPWSGPRSLKDMLRVEDFPEELRPYINDYPLHIIEVNRFEDTELFRTDLRLVFGCLKNQKDPEGWARFMKENAKELSELREDAYDMIAVMSHTEEFMQLKSRFQKGDKVDMCTAMRVLQERQLQAGIDIGMERGMEQFILDNLEEGVPKERILAKLVRRFELTEVQAEEYFTKYGHRE